MGIRETSDTGTPVVACEPDSPVSKAYREIAAKVWEQVSASEKDASRAMPNIVFE
jgi:ATP-binding protein involved in chromosome partitioning